MSKRLRSKAFTVCMKTLLMLLNLLFWMIGMTVLCTGIFMRIQLHNYINVTQENIGAVILMIATIGGILVLVSSCACYCTVKGYPALLFLYGAFLAGVAILQLGMAGSLYALRFSINDFLDDRLNNTMLSYGLVPVTSSHLDTMQSTLKCCGNKGYEDWNMYPQKEVPVSCCKVPHGECDITDPDDIYTEGCYNRIMNFLKERMVFTFWSAKATGVLIVGMILACCLANSINKKQYEDMA